MGKADEAESRLSPGVACTSPAVPERTRWTYKDRQHHKHRNHFPALQSERSSTLVSQEGGIEVRTPISSHFQSLLDAYTFYNELR